VTLGTRVASDPRWPEVGTLIWPLTPDISFTIRAVRDTNTEVRVTGWQLHTRVTTKKKNPHGLHSMPIGSEELRFSERPYARLIVIGLASNGCAQSPTERLTVIRASFGRHHSACVLGKHRGVVRRRQARHARDCEGSRLMFTHLLTRAPRLRHGLRSRLSSSDQLTSVAGTLLGRLRVSRSCDRSPYQCGGKRIGPPPAAKSPIHRYLGCWP
jgi:hypothetical protein